MDETADSQVGDEVDASDGPARPDGGAAGPESAPAASTPPSLTPSPNWARGVTAAWNERGADLGETGT